MNVFNIVLIIIGIILQGLFIYNDNKYHNGLSIVLKTLASLCFVILSFRLCKKIILVNYALILDCLGDFILILRNISPKKYKDLIFVSGTISFFIGHILLSVYLCKLNPNAIKFGIVINLILFLGFALYYLKTLTAPIGMKILGGTYLFMIMFTSGLSISNYIDIQSSSNLLFMIASIIFITSDLILMAHKFNPNSKNYLQPTYRVLYYVSQIMLALYIGII